MNQSNEQSREPRALRDYELSRVPTLRRRSLWVVAAALMAWVINPTPAVVGASVSSGLTFWNTILAIFIGSLVVGLYSLPVSVAGAREGWSTALLARLSFGDKGANVVSAAMSLANVIFFGVVVGVFVATLESLLEMERGSLSIVGSIIFVLLVTASALFGFRAMALLSSITIIPMLLLFIYAAIQGVIEGGGWSSIVTFTPEEPISLAQGITATIGIFIVGATLAADVTRYSRSGGQAMVSSGLTLGLGFFVFVMLGAIAVKGTGTGDLISIIVNSGLGLLGALLLLVSSWTSADNNVYSAGLALSKVFNLPKYFFTIATVVIGGILAATGIYSNLMTYLTIISLLIPPIGGIVAVDYFLVRKRLNVAPAEEMTAPIIRNYNRKALIAWLVAIATDYVTALQLNIGASGLNGLVIGVVVYYLLTRGREARTSEEQQTFPIRERE